MTQTLNNSLLRVQTRPFFNTCQWPLTAVAVAKTQQRRTYMTNTGYKFEISSARHAHWTQATYIPSTNTSTSWAHLLHHPDLTPSEIRSRLLKPRHTTNIPPQFVDSMYRTQMDDGCPPNRGAVPQENKQRPMRPVLVSERQTPAGVNPTHPF